MEPRVAVILNPASGSALSRQELAEALDARGFPADIHVMPGVSDPSWLPGVATRYDVVVAAGGDGTVSAVAAAAFRAGRTLGVIPRGTLNHFARDAGIPADLEPAIDVLRAGHTVPVDVSMVNEHLFLNNASIGAYPQMVWERNRVRRRGWPRPLASALAVASTLLELRSTTVRVTVDGVRFTRRSPFIVVGNGAYEVEGLRAGTRQRLSEGCLTLYAASEWGRLDALLLPVRILFGRLKRHEGFEEWRAAAITMHLPRERTSVALDGEIRLLHSPLHFSVLPRALNVIVAADKEE